MSKLEQFACEFSPSRSICPETEINLTRQALTDGTAHLKRFAEQYKRSIGHDAPPRQKKVSSKKALVLAESSLDEQIKTLLSKQQYAVWELNQKGWSGKEIAKELNVTLGTVKVQIHRAKTKITAHTGIVPERPRPDMIAAAESAGFLHSGLWKWRAKKLKQMSKAKGRGDSDPYSRNVAVLVKAEDRKSPFLQGFSPIKVSLEGDAIYIFPPGIWREMSVDIKAWAVRIELEKHINSFNSFEDNNF